MSWYDKYRESIESKERETAGEVTDWEQTARTAIGLREMPPEDF